MHKYLIIVFMTGSLFAQNFKFGIEYPLLSYSSDYKLIVPEEGNFFYGLGLGGALQYRGIAKNIFLKSSLSFSSNQSFETGKNSFFVITLDLSVDYMFLKNFYGGAGVGLHNYAIVPSTDIKQVSVFGKIGACLNQYLYTEIKYNYLLNDNSMKNFNFLNLSFGYQF